MAHSSQDEISAMQAISEALELLDDNERSRVMNWAIDRFAISVRGLAPKAPIVEQSDAILETAASTYSTFAELYAAVSSACDNSVTDVLGALIAGYWLQVCQGHENFMAISVNKELKNAGYGVKNITYAFNGLLESKPQLVVQLRKTGTSRQARKLFKVTDAGVRKIKEMLDE